MTKKTLNQNDIYVHELMNSIEPDYIFSNKPINRLKVIEKNIINDSPNKIKQLHKLKERISSIENCNLKNNSKNIMNVILIGCSQHFFSIFLLIKYLSDSTSCLPKRSEISTSFNSDTDTLPWANAANPGNILTFTE